jgi:hypothetical protein
LRDSRLLEFTRCALRLSGVCGVCAGVVKESGPDSARRRRLKIECLRDCDCECDRSWGSVDARLSLTIGRGGDCDADGRGLSTGTE